MKYMVIQSGSKIFTKNTIASTDSSSWSKEINILNMTIMINANWFASVEDTLSICNKIFNTKLMIQINKDKLFLKKILIKMSKLKDPQIQVD